MNRTASMAGVLALALVVSGCEERVEQPAERIRTQKWEETVETVEGLPIGRQQVDWEAEAHSLSDEEALERLRVRKRIVARALDDPPVYASLALRQAWTEAFLLEEIEGEKPEDASLDESIAQIRNAVRKEMSEPRGWAATLVTVVPESPSDDGQALAYARQIAEELGPDPSDDAVVALEDGGPEGMKVHVNYGVRFAAPGESETRPGWVRVYPEAAQAIEALPAGDRTSEAFAIDEGGAQFVVKLLAIEGREASAEEVQATVDRRLEDVYRETEVLGLVERLVEEGDWSVNPAAMESDVEEK